MQNHSAARYKAAPGRRAPFRAVPLTLSLALEVLSDGGPSQGRILEDLGDAWARGTGQAGLRKRRLGRAQPLRAGASAARTGRRNGRERDLHNYAGWQDPLLLVSRAQHEWSDRHVEGRIPRPLSDPY